MKKDERNEQGGERSGRQGQSTSGGSRPESTGAQTPQAGGSAGSSLQRGGERGFGFGELSQRPFGQGPFAFMRRISDEMDRLFENFFGGMAGSDVGEWGRGGTWWPQVDVAQHGNAVTVSADLPGVRPEDVRIHIENDTLVIEGERREERESTERGYRRSERSYGSFHRTVRLPSGADLDGAQAQFRDGVLEITVPCEQRQKRNIPIESGGRRQGQSGGRAELAQEQDRKQDKAS